MTTAEDYKKMGNDALQSGNHSSAIEHYTKAIGLDGTNYVYYSNRSAAYLSKGDAANALEDAESCLGLNPDFAKGYSRKGAALHSLKRYNDSIAAYEEGLKRFPNDAGLKSGMESVKKQKDQERPQLFGPDMIARMAMDPKLRGYLNDAEFMAKLKLLQTDPNQIGTMLSDPRFMEVFSAMLGMNGMELRTGDDDDDLPPPPTSTTAPPSTNRTAPPPKQPEPMDEDDDEDLTPEDKKRRQDRLEAVKAKERGNALYKEKKFDEALAAYDEAIALDPANMTFLSNKAAVYFTQKDYRRCVDASLQAVEVGKENRAPFEERAKALSRAARAYQKLGDLAAAIEACRNAQLEAFDKATERLLKTLELEKRKADAQAYLSDEKAEEAKLKGNTHFRNREWTQAVEAYEEAVKRAPKNATIRNNLAAALCKIMDFNGAKRQIEEALALDPNYVKAWARKGDIEVLMKENHRALDSYRKGLQLEPDNSTCKQGLQKVTALINSGATDEERKERASHAMADPEIQAILQDPVIMQVLRDFQEHPESATRAMSDPGVRAKIEKLIAAGVLQTA